jgi:transposase
MTSSLHVDRLDDLPLLVGLLQQLQLDTILERHVGTHGNTLHTNTVGNGHALLIWLAYLLTAGDHRKVVVADWVAQHAAVLSGCLGVPVVASDFSDDRLSTLLTRLQQPTRWAGVEDALLGHLVTVYDPGLTRVHLDATTVHGYHAPDPEGVMRLGFAKAGGAGLAQLKLMAATSARGQLLACVVLPGNAADQPLYRPMVQRIRRQLGSGRLYVGDSKMATQATRADLVAHGDTYLTPLPLTEAGGDPTAWLAHLPSPGQATTLLWRTPTAGRAPELLGGVWETSRRQTVGGTTWDERVLLVYSRAHAQSKTQALHRQLTAAMEAVRALTPPPKRGQRQFREEAALQTAVARVLERHGVRGLLEMTWAWVAGSTPAAGRYVITNVRVDTEARAAREATLGWRVLVTNAPVASLPADAAVLTYREEYVVERCFHLIKDQPVGIRPLWVRTETQLRGLAYLLTLAARVLVYLEHRLHDALVAEGATVSGLHPGQPHLRTDRPTATRVLAAVVRQEPTRVGRATAAGWQYEVVNVTPLLQRILALLDLPVETYTRIANTS